MSKDTPKTEKSAGQAADNDADDVTEIISAEPSAPIPSSDDADVTKIVFGGDKTDQPKKTIQELPGAVIGVAGARAGARPSDDTPDQIHDSDDEDASTKILFDTPAEQTPVSDTPSEPATTDEDASEQSSAKLSKAGPESEIALERDNGDAQNAEPSQIAAQNQPSPSKTDTEEKTVFLPPVSKLKKQDDFNPPVGWLVIIDGPGRGAALTIHYGQNTIGRGDNQQIQLNFGDNRIARETHAYVIYDEIARQFYVRDAGQKNLVRVNQQPVLSPVELKSHDHIQIGATTCLFVPLCTPSFDWLGGEDDPATGPGDGGAS